MDHDLFDIALAQVERFRAIRQHPRTEVSLLLHRARRPQDVRKAILRERPVLELQRTLKLGGPDPARLRAEAAQMGTLDASSDDLDFRRLYPSLDLGIYCANHSIGKPSMATGLAVDEFLAQHAVLGVDAFMEGGWLTLIDELRHKIGQLVGDTGLKFGDVVPYTNASEGISAILSSFAGRLVTTADHFTTAHYAHEAWAARTGGEVVVVPQDDNECTPTERVVDALTADTTVVSLTSAAWRSGYLHDLDAIAEAVRATCPEALFLVDAYQSLGTVPLSVSGMPALTAIVGGGIKQLRAGTGTGFAWLSNDLLDVMRADRTGWWGHAEPMAFAPTPFVPGEGASKLRTGTPSLLPAVCLLTELNVLASAGHDGDLRDSVQRARLITQRLCAEAASTAVTRGLVVRGPIDPERRAAFFGIEVDDGPALLELLSNDGIVVDFRADAPGSNSGLLRMSASAAQFGYELQYVVERIAVALD